MKTFLHISYIETNPDHRLRDLERYYQSKDLGMAIERLVGSEVRPEEIKDKRVLLKPNWVRHSVRPKDDLCLRTNDGFLLAVLNAFLLLKPSHITIGDAPIQGCVFERIVTKDLARKFKELSEFYHIPIRVEDFRRRRYDIRNNIVTSELKQLSEFVIFDLGKDSMLEPITRIGSNQFRVTNYNPDRMAFAHIAGTHKYCISKELFNSDVVISIPKIKTHQKVGITGALKNLVGLNGDKDFLPHHRKGGSKHGGDCYPGGSILRRFAEAALDKANRKQNTNAFWYWQKMSSIIWQLSLPGPEHSIVGGWHGNDTTWRMVEDLNRIAQYGCINGIVHKDPQRNIYSICDGIIGGQGEGPLEPDPLPLGVISFTNNSKTNDRAMAKLMRFPINKLPLLTDKDCTSDSDCNLTINSVYSSFEDLERLSIETIPPKGWAKCLLSR